MLVTPLVAFLLVGPAVPRLPSDGASSRAREGLAGHWEGTASREGKEWRISLDIEPHGEGLRGAADAPDYGLYAMPLQRIDLEGTKVRIEQVERGDKATLRGELEGDRIAGTWEGLGVSAALRLQRVRELATTSDQEEIRFENGEAKLVGTLVKPNRSGRHPAIVFTHGSGNQTRTESFYRSRAHLFARHGVAGFIYDRRGKGASTGGGDSVTFANLADDALAAVRVLQGREDIDPKRVGVGGFSQGGWVSPLAAARSPEVAFVLVGATPGISVDEQNRFSIENMLRKERVAEAKIAEVMRLVERVGEFARKGVGDKAELESRVGRLRGEPWFDRTFLPKQGIERYSPETTEFLSFDPVSSWERVTVPVLSVWGERDRLVPAELSRSILEKALQRAGNKDFTLRIFPKAGHGLSLEPDEGEAWDWPRLAPGYPELMVDWVLSRAGAVK